MSPAAAACPQRSAEGGWRLAGWCGHWSPYESIFKLAFCTNTCRRWSMALKGASKGCAGWHRMPAWRRSTFKPGMMRSSTSSSAYRTQSDQSPPPQNLVIPVRSTGTTVTLPCNQPGPNDDSHASPVPNQPACGLCPGQRCNTGLWCRTHACKCAEPVALPVCHPLSIRGLSACLVQLSGFSEMWCHIVGVCTTGTFSGNATAGTHLSKLQRTSLVTLDGSNQPSGRSKCSGSDNS